ncbi:hypothetical protein D3C71_1770180 [compost metagenome]
MPAASRSCGVRRPWEVVAGWAMVVLLSPRLVVMEITRVASMKRQAPSLPPLTSKLTTAPKPLIWRLASSCCGWLGRPA